MLRLFFCCLALVTGASAQIPSITGYTQVALPRNLPLPVRAQGGGVSEEDVPVILFLPTVTNAGTLDGARAAAGIPGLPASAKGFRLVVLADPIRSPITLRSGRVSVVEIPVFAYEPTVQGADPTALTALLPLGPNAPSGPSATTMPNAPTPPPAATVSVTAPPAFAPSATPAFVPSTSTTAARTPFTLPPSTVTTAGAPQLPNEAGSTPPIAALESTNGASSGDSKSGPQTPSWDDVLEPDLKFQDKISVGEVVVDERQLLRTRLPIYVEFVNRPLPEVLLSLATLAGLDFSIGALPATEQGVTTRFTAAPFAALEQIARQHGAGVYRDKEDPLWVIRRVDPETLIARTYKLSHITLGNSSSASGDKTFGAGFQDDTQQNSGRSSMSGSGGMGMGGMGGYGGAAGGYGGGMSGGYGSSGGGYGMTSRIVLPHDATTFGNRFTQASDVLFTIRSILGLIESNPMVSDLSADPENPGKLSTKAAQPGQGKANGLVAYNADARSLFVVGTEKQQAWVAEYLKLVDLPAVTIAVDALFLESDVHPNEKLGIDWADTFVDWNVSGPSSLNWGEIGRQLKPRGATLTTDGFSAKLSAFITNTKSRVARYPRVVTHNNREVRIATTSNIPIITQASTVSGVATPSGYPSGVAATNYEAGTQEVGTIITLLASKAGENMVHLKISIEISSTSGQSTGEQLTGRIPTTSTTYEGEVEIPAGRTLAIGGLERIAESSGISRVPWLSKIPLFGFVFKKSETDFSNTNITLFITPRFIDANGLPDVTAGAAGQERAIQHGAALQQRATKEADLSSKGRLKTSWK